MLGLVLALIFGCAIASPIDLNPKILNGSNAHEGQFPYQVSLRRTTNNKHFCGGSIISPEWILTTAHCVLDFQANSIVVVVGAIYLNQGGYSYGISYIIHHNDYNPGNKFNNIAVLRVNGVIKLGGNVDTINLETSKVSAGESLTLSGWGFNSYPPNLFANNLQYVELKSMSVKTCRNSLKPSQIFDSNICTSSPKGRGACNGDHGGPLVNSQSLQVGVLSWVIPCGTDSPDVFTSVPDYRDWIKVVTGV